MFKKKKYVNISFKCDLDVNVWNFFKEESWNSNWLKAVELNTNSVREISHEFRVNLEII